MGDEGEAARLSKFCLYTDLIAVARSCSGSFVYHYVRELSTFDVTFRFYLYRGST